jgi:hypothetical protein
MKIYLSCLPEKRQQKALTKVGYKHRLMSYFYLRKKKPDVLRNIVETGLVPDQKSQKPRDKKDVDDK